ncbi:MAG: hypothetical protein KDD84_13305 [Caldilineaceae bacterium]|nr:hypothetical protein [Caldilineaceae bacterium]
MSDILKSDIPTTRQIRQELYRSYTEDGLLDIALGLTIGGFGALLLVGQPWLVTLLGPLALLTWYVGKRTVTLPRVGEFLPERTMQTRLSRFALYLVALGAGALALFVGVSLSGANPAAAHPLALFGLVLAAGVGVLGLMVKAQRFYLYGFLIFAAMAVGEAVNAQTPGIDTYLLAVLLAGGVILISGMAFLVAFVRNNPVISLEE